SPRRAPREGAGPSRSAAAGVPAKLRALGVRPSKRLGQNFLCDPRVAARIAALIEDPAEPVVEIGPGLGALSLHLAATGRPFVAVELDLRLADAMEGELGSFPRARVVRGDILDQRLDALVPGPERITIVGNLPYSITTPALEWVVGQADRVRRALLMVQREYAERLTATPGSKEYGTVSVFVGLNAAVRRLFRVSPGSFHPRPQVESLVLEVVPRPYPGTTAEEREAAARLARASMGTRRKTLGNSLARGLGVEAAEARAVLDDAGLDPSRRGETLTIDDFVRLARAWMRRGSPGGAA
ncbi:MAG TPA: 16S rRNA (adenine(1518)-N(6)/adenine(1519)-N(6))-dimethyltransferase RsmA, partial [Candidatus Methylomirabilis sp.]|nr:16S rRNA (adenine(1518)-N(6)/adenine(1519)-N(6))-dimethyltransferase RsmA [Candidatus Methylomirabilis sp.]